MGVLAMEVLAMGVLAMGVLAMGVLAMGVLAMGPYAQVEARLRRNDRRAALASTCFDLERSSLFPGHLLGALARRRRAGRMWR